MVGIIRIVYLGRSFVLIKIVIQVEEAVQLGGATHWTLFVEGGQAVTSWVCLPLSLYTFLSLPPSLLPLSPPPQ